MAKSGQFVYYEAGNFYLYLSLIRHIGILFVALFVLIQPLHRNRSMNQSLLSSQSGIPPGFSSPPPSTIEEQALIWQQVLAHSLNGLVGLIAIRDDSGTIVNFQYRFINQIALRDTFRGRPNDIHDITGKLLTEFFPSISQTPLWQTYLSVVETGQPRRVEQNYKEDKRDVWVSQSVSRFGQDGLLLSYNETSELHLAARRIAQQSALLNGVLNSSPNGIIVYEAVYDHLNQITDFQAVLVNQMLETITGQEELYFIQKPLSAIYPLGPERMQRLRQLIDTGNPLYRDEYIPALGRWLSMTLTRLNNGFVVTLKDITADRQVRQQLEDTVQELHRSNKNLEQFAYVASHDLQEPLRKIVSFGDVLNDQFANDMSESAADLVRRMQRSAGRMRSLVQDLLTYARLSGNAASFGLVDLNHLIVSVLDDLDFTIAEKRATVQLENLPAIWGDSALLRHLFQNLVSNALKFHKPGTRPHVTVRGHVAASHELRASALLSDNLQSGRRYAIIEVVDNGIGFNERYLDRIFTLFQRLHNQLNFSGTGVGLAICRKIIDLHNGQITAISQEGQGATFQLVLPMQELAGPLNHL
jgi:signal transduction histidine kinase